MQFGTYVAHQSQMAVQDIEPVVEDLSFDA